MTKRLKKKMKIKKRKSYKKNIKNGKEITQTKQMYVQPPAPQKTG